MCLKGAWQVLSDQEGEMTQISPQRHTCARSKGVRVNYMSKNVDDLL